MRLFMDLTKSGIVVFVLLSGFAGYALSFPQSEPFEWMHLLLTMSSLYFMSAGAFAINQAQDRHIDALMPRTSKRPIPSGKVSSLQAYVLGFGFLLLGTLSGLLVNPLVAALGIFSAVLYNFFYTLYWKRRWAFGAVPGALPGAMPVLIGYAANSEQIWAPQCVYAFMIMFLWQMPHFWSLAIKFKDDYAKGGIPVLPVRIGTEATLYHMGLYVFAYIALAIASPFFTSAYWIYLIIVLPMAFKVLYEFFRYCKTGAQTRWLSFFLWINFSMLIFLLAPVVDKWQRYFMQ
jgi:protoheme IX farnesyltransferase